MSQSSTIDLPIDRGDSPTLQLASNQSSFYLSPTAIITAAASGSNSMTAPTLVRQYIEKRDRGYWIEGTRISLDSVVYSFLNGESPESISQNFPLLSLEQVYGAIAFYLANQGMVDAYLAEEEIAFQGLEQSLREKSPLLYKQLKAAQDRKKGLV
jgi:uncharacterized protein (DUF433 family)